MLDSSKNYSSSYNAVAVAHFMTPGLQEREDFSNGLGVETKCAVLVHICSSSGTVPLGT